MMIIILQYNDVNNNNYNYINESCRPEKSELQFQKLFMSFILLTYSTRQILYGIIIYFSHFYPFRIFITFPHFIVEQLFETVLFPINI
jgi:hypothetical protein